MASPDIRGIRRSRRGRARRRVGAASGRRAIAAAGSSRTFARRWPAAARRPTCPSRRRCSGIICRRACARRSAAEPPPRSAALLGALVVACRCRPWRSCAMIARGGWPARSLAPDAVDAARRRPTAFRNIRIRRALLGQADDPSLGLVADFSADARLGRPARAAAWRSGNIDASVGELDGAERRELRPSAEGRARARAGRANGSVMKALICRGAAVRRAVARRRPRSRAQARPGRDGRGAGRHAIRTAADVRCVRAAAGAGSAEDQRRAVHAGFCRGSRRCRTPAARRCSSARACSRTSAACWPTAQPDEGQLKDRLKQLQEIESRGQAEARKAYDAIDQVLDLRQQAQFRVFEEQMERRKIELVTRARQANRANRGAAPGRTLP